MTIPSLHGNWIDLLVIMIIFIYLVSGWSRGFIIGILDLVGFLLSFIGALKLYSLVGAFLIANFSLSRGIANALGFLLSGIMVELLFSTLIHLFLENIIPKFIKSDKTFDRFKFLFKSSHKASNFT